MTYRVNKKYTPIFQFNMHSVAPVCMPINAQVHCAHQLTREFHPSVPLLLDQHNTTEVHQLELVVFV